MGQQGGHGAAVDGVLNGVLTGLWYASPDVVASRRARGLLKVAVLVGGSAVHAARGAKAAGSDPADAVDADAPAPEADLSTLVARMRTEPVIDAQSLGLGETSPGRCPRKAKAIAVTLVVLTIVGTVAGERAIYRWGERLTARGVRHAHTRIGLVAGGVTGVSSWALAR
ncbi:hypothetical protein AA0Y32_05440 [Georgenia phoenicis]|uniref:hypothetical protein n=1 Tax=unclassified Georgenia TaxID=2626815 RepID=UPI0039AFBC91